MFWLTQDVETYKAYSAENQALRDGSNVETISYVYPRFAGVLNFAI